MNPLVQLLSHHAPPADAGLDTLGALLAALPGVLARLDVDPAPAPWGRYLVHDDPAGRFNVQLDIFSAPYTGGIHNHGTWGFFVVLRGLLAVEDHAADGPGLLRSSLISAGGAMAFDARSDWHRVRTFAGEQTKSIHVYGPGFDPRTGQVRDETGVVRSYTRGAWGEPAVVGQVLRWR